MEKEHSPKGADFSGKVREVYDTGDGKLVIITTDRISAFDVVLPTLIPGKGQVLNSLSNFWFSRTSSIIANHLITADNSKMPREFRSEEYEGRAALVKKLKMLPYEVIVRGYMFGSMYEAYKKGEMFLGHAFGKKYEMAQKLDEPIVTPSTKAKEGHDVNITVDTMKKELGEELGGKVVEAALKVYKACYSHALSRGIIIADTKFEFALDDKGTLTLADEVLTPDSSRFWDAKAYKTGSSPSSFDKQFVRDYLKSNGLDGKSGVALPKEIVDKTAALYQECRRRIIG